MTSKIEVDLNSRAFREDPYPTYARLRASAPVCRTTMPDGQVAWLVTRYDDALTVLKDPRFSNDRATVRSEEQAARLPWIPKFFKPITRTLLDVDPPDHTRLRGLVHKAFTPGLVENMRARIQPP